MAGSDSAETSSRPRVGQRLSRRFLRSTLVWRLSGLSYRTAVLATHGSFESPDGYLDACRRQMSAFRGMYNPRSRVLEYGCGLGGNLIAIGPGVDSALGLDVNWLYLRHARRLSRSFGAKNIEFKSLSRSNSLSRPASIDFAFSIGVFERLPRESVLAAVRQLLACLTGSGVLAAYFLNDRARGSPFSSRLGDDAYVLWSDEEIRSLVEEASGLIIDKYPWGKDGRAKPREDSVATMIVARPIAPSPARLRKADTLQWTD